MGLQIQSNAEIAEELGLGHFRSLLAKSGFVFFGLRKVVLVIEAHLWTLYGKHLILLCAVMALGF